MKYFDVHTHVQFAAYENDYREVIKRALAAGTGLINVGTQQDTSRRAVEIAHEFENESVYPHTNFASGEKNKNVLNNSEMNTSNDTRAARISQQEFSGKVGVGVYATVGLHPIHTEASYHDKKELGEGEAAKEFVSRGEEFDYEMYKKLAADPKVVAIGECGLDYYRLGEETKKKQAEVLAGQIQLAHETGKPLMIHCRNAFGDLIAILKSRISNPQTDSPGVIHFFTGTKDDAKALLDLGFAFTFGGVVTFARDYDEVIRCIPLDRILSETDAPYVAPAPYRGKRNEPAYIVETVKKLAELKKVSEDEMAEQILKNASRIFAL